MDRQPAGPGQHRVSDADAPVVGVTSQQLCRVQPAAGFGDRPNHFVIPNDVASTCWTIMAPLNPA